MWAKCHSKGPFPCGHHGAWPTVDWRRAGLTRRHCTSAARKALSGRGVPSLPSPLLLSHARSPQPFQGPREPNQGRGVGKRPGGQWGLWEAGRRSAQQRALHGSSGRQRAHWAPKCHVASCQDTD